MFRLTLKLGSNIIFHVIEFQASIARYAAKIINCAYMSEVVCTILYKYHIFHSLFKQYNWGAIRLIHDVICPIIFAHAHEYVM